MEKLNQDIYVWHTDHPEFCYNKEHRKKFQGECYYKVSRPTFMERCDCRLREKSKLKLYKIYLFLGLQCTCTTQNTCKLCRPLCDSEITPYLYINYTNQIDIKILFDLIECNSRFE